MGPLCWPEGILGVLSRHAGQALGGHPGQRSPVVRASCQVAIVVQSPGKGLTGKFLGGRVRAGEPNARNCVQRAPPRSTAACLGNGMSF